MKEERRQFWQVPIGEAICWPVPAMLAAFAHLYASPKAGMTGTAPGLRLALMNDETIGAQRAWHFVQALPHPFLLYGLMLLAVSCLLRLKGIRLLFRFIVFAVLAIPGLWYFKAASYLGGKIMTM